MSPEPFVSRAKAPPAKRSEKGYGDENVKSAARTGLNNVCACAGCHDNISKISARTRCVVLLSFYTTEWRKWSREFPFIIESNVCIPSFYSDKSYFEHFKAHNEVFFENKCPVIRQNFICNWWHLRDWIQPLRNRCLCLSLPVLRFMKARCLVGHSWRYERLKTCRNRWVLDNWICGQNKCIFVSVKIFWISLRDVCL